ncbi:MAG: hypothetical protein FD163_940 [Hyphomonadaceae bacterium]|nr:MAG: hypothetical protein FD128_2750 [Hyphomonadaceae bacterium]KAF0186272.1 MAG: hypothetical protein FD163_940 [Hyphomonadaceae bacterium]
MIEKYQDYQSDVTCEAFVVAPNGDKRPAVLIAHTWSGQLDFERQIARDIVDLGYVGIAIDTFGKGMRGEPGADNTHLIAPLMSDRKLLKSRVLAALDFAKNCENVDASKIAIIGFCFGGLCALDLARTGTVDLRAAISFHGLFMPPNIGEQAKVNAKVLILHGYDDPLAKPDAMIGIADEMTKAGADWQLLAFGNTSHAFTNPMANNPAAGMVYSKQTADRAFAAMRSHLKEAFE